VQVTNAGATVVVSRFIDPTLGPRDQCSPECDAIWFIPTNKNGIWYDQEGAAIMFTVDPDAASKNAMYQFGVGYKPNLTVPVQMTERGAATMTLESIVSNQPKAYWGVMGDNDTDAFDFHIPITARMVGVTTATVRLVGVSKNATPSGNIGLKCALNAVRPGTDTYAAHVTTGEQSITLTPAVQNRPVAATSAAITINGTIADGGQLWGSCEADATITTSAQMTDFRLDGQGVLILIGVNSWTD
jgi:hypothetical protein